jgi:GNAT superfamily N-acetyltransferase
MNQTVSNLAPDAASADATSVTPATPVHYRVVADAELLLLEPLFRKLGWALPDPDFAKAVVAEAGEGPDALILGFSVVQFVPHSEPMWVDPNCRGTGIAEGLMAAVTHYIELDCHIRRYLCVAKPGSFAARLCERNHMALYPGQVWVRQV